MSHEEEQHRRSRVVVETPTARREVVEQETVRQPPPGYYPPPPGYGYSRPAGNGKAITALVLGIGSIVFCFFFFFDALLVIPGLIFGIIAMNETKARGGSGRGMALAGVVCSIIGAVLATIMSVLLIRAVNQCGGFEDGNVPGFQDCVQEHIF